MQREVLAVGQHDGVTGVVAALVAHHPLHLAAEQVGGLALALVAPLGADQHDRRHVTLQSSPVRHSEVPESRQGRVTDQVGHDDAHVVLLTCADDGGSRGGAAPTCPRWSCPRAPDGPTSTRCSPIPTGGRLVVAGTDADLAAVLLRLLRASGSDVEVAYVPASTGVGGGAGLGAAAGPAALDWPGTARHGPAPLVRDDAGGVLVGRAELRGDPRRGVLRRRAGAARRGPPAGGDALAGRAGVASVDGTTGGVAVRAGLTGRLPDGRVRAVAPTARAGRGAATGRAVQVGCLPATLVRDGVAAPAPGDRAGPGTGHVADWLLVRGAGP